MTVISLLGYTMGISVLLVDFLKITDGQITCALIHMLGLTIIGVVFFWRYLKIWFCANFLGYCLATGFMLTNRPETWSSFGVYVIFMSTFHYLEFLTTALSNPANLSVDSYLLNHSLQYGFAALASWIEYGVELWAFPNLKVFNYFGICGFGILICFFGDALRKTAMLQAGKSFNHIVQGTKAKEHQLVTHGVFSFVRHPSYLGWFLFSIGTQMILSNPICFIAYLVVTWQFFKERIYIEEYILLQFFGDAYSKYQNSVKHTGIPFVRGFQKPS